MSSSKYIKGEEILIATKCIKLLQSYSKKLENQCEKCISSFEDSEEDAEHILDEDYRICAKATECFVELEVYLANIRCTDENEVKSEQEYSDVNEIQKQMQSFMLELSSRHHEFVERQNKNQ
ncbi:hypothetical protein DPMN_160257 [Dreissena polymorpha]|uniref:Uncharacterized protein n=1 Tax=Dreissena polymorpha TaxID=45954 RepID=A0A9D4EQV5_DREPO|nr:hypothetical protein DPMN_160257 [Dreissena polymorpha]